MGKLFWAYETDLPQGSGFDMFSVTHCLWIVSSLLIVMLLAVMIHFLKPDRQLKIERILAVVITASYFLRWIWAALIGHYNPAEMLPLHLCAAAALAEVLAVYTRKSWLMDFGYACGLPGSLVAFIIPGVGHYPVWHFNYLMFTIDHMILILLPIVWIIHHDFRPDYHNLPHCLIVTILLAGFDYVVNPIIGSNFMFVSFVQPNTPLTAIGLRLGVPGYQLAMGLLLLLTWALIYTPWILIKPVKHG
jgi:hypothetical integral membrane protein (TIGR02206 family)